MSEIQYIRLYSGVTPNTPNGVSMVFSAMSTYLDFLAPHLLKSVESDSYRINRNELKVKIDETLTVDNYAKITYVFNTVDGTFYYVDDCDLQSGMAVYKLSIDNWATYLLDCRFSKSLITRCNRNIGTGVYDPIQSSNDFEIVKFPILANQQIIGNPDFLDLQYCDLVMRVHYTNISGKNATALIAANLADVVAPYYSQLAQSQIDSLYTPAQEAELRAKTSIVEIAQATACGINQLAVYSIGATTANEPDCTADKFWIIPEELLNVETYNSAMQNTVQKFRTEYATFALAHQYPFVINCRQIHKGTISLRKEINTSAQYRYVAGTRNRGIPIENQTSGTAEVYYRCFADIDDLTITVESQSNVLDITDEFTFKASTPTNNDAIDGIAKVLQTGLGEMASVMRGLIIPSPVAKVMSASNVVGGITDAIANGQNKPQELAQNGNGNAISNFYSLTLINNIGTVAYPLAFTRTKSIKDEIANAQLKGARFSESIPLFEPILGAINQPLLPELAIDSDTFIQGSVEVDSVNTSVRNDISSRFSNGSYFRQL